MPHKIQIKSDRIVFTFTGVVSDVEFRRSADELRQILSTSPDLHELVNYTNVQRFDVEPSTMRAIAENPPLFSERSFQVFVAPETVVFGMSRMYQLLTQKKRPNMTVVRTLAEAEQLLDSMGDGSDYFPGPRNH